MLWCHEARKLGMMGDSEEEEARMGCRAVFDSGRGFKAKRFREFQGSIGFRR